MNIRINAETIAFYDSSDNEVKHLNNEFNNLLSNLEFIFKYLST